jgi:hypothetical protein
MYVFIAFYLRQLEPLSMCLEEMLDVNSLIVLNLFFHTIIKHYHGPLEQISREKFQSFFNLIGLQIPLLYRVQS